MPKSQEELEDRVYGVGIALDKSWDLNTSTSGDIDLVSGIDELEKDIAFKITFILQQVKGRNPTEKLRQRVIDRIRQVLQRDQRIRSIQSVEIDFVDRTETMTVQIEATGTTQGFIFTEVTL